MVLRGTHPNALLPGRRNYTRGLESRSAILRVLEGAPATAGEAARRAGLSPKGARYHLHLLEKAGVIRRTRHLPPRWEATGGGQRRLQFP